MTTLDESLELALDMAREVKQARARKKFTDILTTLFVYRGDELVAMVWPDRIDRNDMLAAASMMAVGFCPDLLAMAFETFTAVNQLKNPLTGKDWAPGDMQDLAENHDGRGRGWISDALLVATYNRAGDHKIRTLPYRIANKQVVWLDSWDRENEEPEFSGIVPNAMNAAMMNAPTLDVLLARLGVAGVAGLDIEGTLAHQDCATAKVLTGDISAPAWVPRCTVALGAKQGSQRERIIRKSIPGARVMRTRPPD